MTPNYPQLTIEELKIILSTAIRQFFEKQRNLPINNTKWIELCYKIYYETQNTGAIFFDIDPDYTIEKEGD